MIFFIHWQHKRLFKHVEKLGSSYKSQRAAPTKINVHQAQCVFATVDYAYQIYSVGCKSPRNQFLSFIPFTVQFSWRVTYANSISAAYKELSSIEKEYKRSVNINKKDTQQFRQVNPRPTTSRTIANNNRLLEKLFKAIQHNAQIDEIVCLLADVDINATYSRTQMTLLGYAAIHGTEEVVQLLLDNGADPQLKVDGETPSQLAKANDRPDIAKLIAAKTKPIYSTKEERTAPQVNQNLPKVCPSPLGAKNPIPHIRVINGEEVSAGFRPTLRT